MIVTFPDITPDLKAAMPELRGRLLANQSLAELTWFRVGGPAQVLFTPADEDDLAYFLNRLPQELPVYVVGVGSNLIVRDGGMPGVVIRLAPRAFGETRAVGDVVTAGAAALDKRVAETAAAADIGGMEFFFGIPGTVGGALRMNAGANGGETKDVLIEATGIGRDGTKHTFGNADMKFVYRNSGVDPSIVFTSARFRGTITDAEVIRARMNEVQSHRETAQPDPRKDRRLDLQESTWQQRLEADRRRRLPRPQGRRRAGVGDALQFPDQHRQRHRARHRDARRDGARTGQAKQRN
ncbi:UDP-N-acetylmuramate dehydrogenase [Bradyrhizobium sp. USDA 3256]